jgi:hypothetical protein
MENAFFTGKLHLTSRAEAWKWLVKLVLYEKKTMSCCRQVWQESQCRDIKAQCYRCETGHKKNNFKSCSRHPKQTSKESSHPILVFVAEDDEEKFPPCLLLQ